MCFEILCYAHGSPVGVPKVPGGAVNDWVCQVEHISFLGSLQIYHNKLSICHLVCPVAESIQEGFVAPNVHIPVVVRPEKIKKY